jgi:hypothetical protein
VRLHTKDISIDDTQQRPRFHRIGMRKLSAIILVFKEPFHVTLATFMDIKYSYCYFIMDLHFVSHSSPSFSSL